LIDDLNQFSEVVKVNVNHVIDLRDSHIFDHGKMTSFHVTSTELNDKDSVVVLRDGIIVIGDIIGVICIRVSFGGEAQKALLLKVDIICNRYNCKTL